MNILHLKYALEVEKTESITKAAKNLFIGQPNLSKAIKELETVVGFNIFLRNPKGMTPTRRGKELLEQAREIIARIDELDTAYLPVKPTIQRFTISIPRASYISRAFTKFVQTLDSEKDIELNFFETNSIQAINNIIETECNLGIIRFQTTHEKYYLDLLEEKNIQYKEIWQFEYLLLMSNNHPLANTPSVAYSDLQNYIEIVHGDLAISSNKYSGMQKNQDSIQPKKRIFVYERGSQFDLLCHNPETYMWVSPVPADLACRFQLTQRKCKVDNWKFKDVLIFSKGYQFTTQDHAFITEIFKSKDEVSSIVYR
ncbi:MAG: LysR family transcriptional regulator [Flexilinea sp.]